MRDTLYLQLRDSAADGPLPYALAGAHQGLGITAEHAPLDAILKQAAGRRVVAFVPAADVRLASVNVPARQAQKVLQAAPYVLEEQLAEDVETLHFAIGQRQPDGSHPVAIIARSHLDQWMGRFQARGLRPDALVPETLCLPAPENGRWTALADETRVIVRTGISAGFTCALRDFASYLDLADPERKTPIRMFVTREVTEDFTRLNRPIELLPGHGSALEVLVRHWQPAINLLQGDYSQKEDWQRLARPWRIAASLGVAWIALAFAYQGVEAWRLGAEIEAQEARNLERFQAIFPGQTPTADLARQVESIRAQMLGGGGQAPLFALLEILAASLTATPGLDLRSVQYRGGALYLILTSQDLATYENLRGWFAARTEARIDPQSVDAGGDSVQIRLKLELA